MELDINLTPAEASRAIYEYLVRRGYPGRIKVVRVEGGAAIDCLVQLKTCALCEGRTVLEGFGARTMDCECAAKKPEA